MASAAIAANSPHDGPSITLFERANFVGRHITYRAAASHQGFVAHSARSTGLWTVCDGRDVASTCQTVNGAAPTLKLAPAILHPGIDAVALYEQPGLKGRRMVYSFASETPPPFAAKSARTWGGPWSLCDAHTGRCQTIDGQTPAKVEVAVSDVHPGKSPPRLQIALASPPPAEPPVPVRAEPAEAPASPRRPEPPPPVAPRDVPAVADALPAAAAALPPPEPSPPREVAEAQSPYVEVPLPPRAPLARDQDLSLQDEPPPAGEEERRAYAAPPPIEVGRPRRRVSYVCDDGQGLTVVFDDRQDTAELLSDDQDPVVLRRQESQGSGFLYEGRGLALFGAGDRAGYAVGDRAPVDCFARSSRDQLSQR